MPLAKRNVSHVWLKIRNIYAFTLYNHERTTLLLQSDQGPSSGLQLTLNVQQYENLPFSDQDSGIKVSLSFTIYEAAVDYY